MNSLCLLLLPLLTTSAAHATPLAEAEFAVSAPGQEDAEARFLELRARFNEDFQAYRKELAAARKEGREPALAHPAAAHYPAALELGRAGSGQALYWCLQQAPQSGKSGAELSTLKRELYGRVAEDHADEGFVDVVLRMLRGESREDGIGRQAAADLCRGISERATDPARRAKALYYAGRTLGYRTTDEIDLALSIAVFEEVLERFPDSEMAPLASGQVFKYERLRVGMPAPEVVTQDVDGNEWRLSDFRGKVVVLSFWGFWCPPCVAMLPHEREMAKEYAERPFALVGVNTDEDPAEYKEKAEQQGVTWTNSWQGSKKGPWVVEWGTTSFPTFYVIDAEGVIRHVLPSLPTDERAAYLERAVAELVAEAEAGAGASEAQVDAEALEEEYTELATRWNLDGRFLRGESRRKLVDTLWPDFARLAEEGSPEALRWLLDQLELHELDRVRQAEQREELAWRMVRRHPQDPLVRTIPVHVFKLVPVLGLAKGEEILEAIVRHAEDADVRAHAAYRHAALVEDFPESAEDRERARKLYEAFLKEFAEHALAQPATQRAEVLARVRVGRPAPQLQGEDHLGRAHDLEALRGRPVLVTFWDFGPRSQKACEADAALHERYGDDLALLGVCGIRNPAAYPRRAKAAGVTWPTVLQSGPVGPLMDLWGVKRAPMRFLVDAEGVLRHVEVGPGTLDAAVASLMGGPDQQGR